MDWPIVVVLWLLLDAAFLLVLVARAHVIERRRRSRATPHTIRAIQRYERSRRAR